MRVGGVGSPGGERTLARDEHVSAEKAYKGHSITQVMNQDNSTFRW
jgi:ribosome maturation factor RimP